MSESHFETDIFSLERRPQPTSLVAGAEPYFPYAAAWTEFDKLQKTAQGRGPLRLVLWIFELLMSVVGFYGFHLAKGSKLLVIAAWGAALAAELLYQFNGRRRFLRWECPRCHSEWPGTKTEKDRECAICGLRLHQLSP
jgi:hypothetical protein